MDTLFRTKQYIKHLIKARPKGHWIHSPFVFQLASEVFPRGYPYYVFRDLADLRHGLQSSTERIEVQDFGAGSHRLGQSRSLGQITKTSAISRQYGELLFRLVNRLKPINIIELGTSIGLGTAYLATANSRTPVHTIEACPQTADLARINHQLLGIENVTRHVGTFEDRLPGILQALNTVGLVFFDGNHRQAPTLDYFERCLAHADEHSIFVFDDIYWSKDMAAAWQQIKAHPKVTVSIDLYRMGMVFLRKGIIKQDFWVRV